MADAATGPMESLSSWWKVAALVTMAAGFAVLILLTVKAYQNAPPIPDKFVDPAGAVVFTADDVIAGQQVFLKHGLMDMARSGATVPPLLPATAKMVLARQIPNKLRTPDEHGKDPAYGAGPDEARRSLLPLQGTADYGYAASSGPAP